ncbi:acyl-CoA mutase large subunit family protein [Streptomyces thinghirensis]|nr:acyl-CoA mutase large subunit family protein [Streptomyces thinghirensis]
MLKEYIARGTCIFPPKPSPRLLIADIFKYSQGRDPEVEHHLDLRLPHGRGRCPARAGDRVHPRGRHRVRAHGGRGRHGRRRRLLRPASPSSSWPVRRSWRRSPCAAGCAGSGRG